MAKLSRRTLLASAAATALSAPAVAGAAATVPTDNRPKSKDPSTWSEDEKLWVIARQDGAVTEQRVIWRTRGVIYAFGDPQSPVPLVRFKGCDQQWWRPQDDCSFLRTKAFLTYFTDYETDEMIEEFTNPVTGKTTRPTPNSNRLRNGQRLTRRGWSHNDIEKAFPDYYRQFSIHDMEISVIGDSLSIHSKVNWPEPIQRQPYNQDNTYFASMKDIMDTNLDWVPSHSAGHILMPRLAKLGMDDPKEGRVLWHLEKYKVASYDDLPRDYVERATAEFDDFGVDPVNDEEPSRLERRIQRAIS